MHSLHPSTAHRPPRPSPLAKVHFTRPISMDPTMGLVRDPKFWKRFSTAVHLTETQIMKDIESGNGSLKSSSTFDVKEKEEYSWLSQQRKEKRNCRILCAAITCAIILLIVAAVVVYLWFTRWRK